MAKRAAVVLAGCGFLDGSEITEAVLSLYFLERAGFETACFAPDRDQLHVVDHLRGDVVEGEVRNVLVEAARIARGAVKPLSEASMSDFDGLVMPGGFGAAKNLSDFALEGARCRVEPDLVRLVGEAAAARKAICAICISPAVLAAALRGTEVGATLTIGEDAGTAEAIAALGCEHQDCPVTEAVVDEEHRIVSCPAYMYDSSPAQVGAGIEAAIAAFARLAGA